MSTMAGMLGLRLQRLFGDSVFAPWPEMDEDLARQLLKDERRYPAPHVNLGKW